jgi:hypothetical protein
LLYFEQQHHQGDMKSNLVEIVLKAIAVAMGIAVVVLNFLGTLEFSTAVTLLGIGLAALAIAGFKK